MINHVDDIRESKSTWAKRARRPVSCGVNAVLSRITKKKFQDSCDASLLEDKKKLLEIAKKWKNWYKNEYPSWVEDQEKLNIEISEK